MPTIITSDGRIMTLYSHEFDSGMKLMEHSWIGNDFVNAVYSLIYKNKKRVAWIGDYSGDDYVETSDAYAKALPEKEFMEIYSKVWAEKDKYRIPKKHFSPHDLNILTQETKRMYLLNHAKKLYLDMNRYIFDATVKDGTGKGWCVNPLPLLTACGDGRGGGDFRNSSKNKGDKDVGIWAFDLLEYTDYVPDGYPEAQFCFIER